ncbi:MAG: HAD family hydrolase [Candidatus Aenigmatarchaeota archaeon]
MQALVFDFGNVIYSYDKEIFFKKLLEVSNIRESKARALFYYEGLEDRVSTGEISEDEFFHRVKEKFQADLTKDEFDEIYCSMFEPNNRVIGLIEELSEDYRIQLFSDINPIHYRKVVKECEVYPYIDAETLSFEVGTLKRERAGYKDAIEKSGAKRLDIVFIDDILEYIKRARSLGIHGIHYKGFRHLVDRLRDLGVEI